MVVKSERGGWLTFMFQSEPNLVRQCFILRTIKYKSEAKENEQMVPGWFAEKEIPYEHMWQADELWLPKALAGDLFEGWFLYDNPESKQLIGGHLELVKSLS